MAHPKRSEQQHQSRRVRVRSRRLEEIDETKIAVALAIMARRLLELQRDHAADADGLDSREAV